MPQRQLPLFPTGSTQITPEIAFHFEDGKVCYFNGHLPVFIHDKSDLATFRFFTSQLIVNGNATQAQISRAFGVPLVTVKRYVKLYRTQGPKGFYAPPRMRSASKLTPAVLARAQLLLEEGSSVPEVARALELLPNTLHKAIRAGRLRKGFEKKKTRQPATL